VPLELDYLNWDLGFGHIQTNIYPWSQPQWVPRLVESESPALPTVAPGDVATAETAFEDFDGVVHVVIRDSIWAQFHRDKGWREVPVDTPDRGREKPPDTTRHEPPPVVSSDPQAGVSEDAATVAVDWGTIFSGAVDIWQGQQVGGAPTVYSAPAQFAGSSIPSTVGTTTMNGSCGCNSNPCVCGTINGRPALVDPRTGKRCYRRRRRVMLTEGDFNTLLRIATLPNNANVRTALAKAIGRR